MGSLFSPKQTTSTTTNEPNPQMLQAYLETVNRAQNVANLPYQQYTGPTTAGWTPDQIAAFQNIESSQNLASPYFNSAAQMIGQGASPTGYQQFSPGALNQYMSPYQQSVIDSTMANINETNAEQQEQLKGNAISAGAWGGDRAGVAAGELARQQGLASNQTYANLWNQNYSQALGEFNNQQQTGLSAAQADAYRQLYGSGMMSGLGTTAQNSALTGAGALLGAGNQQQALAQSQLTGAANAFAQQQAYPFYTTNFLSGVTSGLGSLAGGTQSSTQPGPSVGQQVIGAGLAAAPFFIKRGGEVPALAEGGPVVSVESGVPQIEGKFAAPHFTGAQGDFFNPLPQFESPTPSKSIPLPDNILSHSGSTSSTPDMSEAGDLDDGWDSWLTKFLFGGIFAQGGRIEDGKFPFGGEVNSGFAGMPSNPIGDTLTQGQGLAQQWRPQIGEAGQGIGQYLQGAQGGGFDAQNLANNPRVQEWLASHPQMQGMWDQWQARQNSPGAAQHDRMSHPAFGQGMNSPTPPIMAPGQMPQAPSGLTVGAMQQFPQGAQPQGGGGLGEVNALNPISPTQAPAAAGQAHPIPGPVGQYAAGAGSFAGGNWASNPVQGAGRQGKFALGGGLDDEDEDEFGLDLDSEGEGDLDLIGADSPVPSKLPQPLQTLPGKPNFPPPPEAKDVAPESGGLISGKGLAGKKGIFGLDPERQALVQAGLAIMSSGSPYPLQAIGQGLSAGLGSYEKSRSDEAAQAYKSRMAEAAMKRAEAQAAHYSNQDNKPWLNSEGENLVMVYPSDKDGDGKPDTIDLGIPTSRAKDRDARTALGRERNAIARAKLAQGDFVPVGPDPNDPNKTIFADKHNPSKTMVVSAPFTSRSGSHKSVAQWKHDAWLQVHPDDKQGALDFASGIKSMDPASARKSAFMQARQEAHDMSTSNPDTFPDLKAQETYINARGGELASMFSAKPAAVKPPPLSTPSPSLPHASFGSAADVQKAYKSGALTYDEAAKILKEKGWAN